MELASFCGDFMTGGGGDALTRTLGASAPARTREVVALPGASSNRTQRRNGSLRVDRRVEQTGPRLSFRVGALASGNEDLRAEKVDTSLHLEQSFEQEKVELDAAALVEELKEVYGSGRTRSVEWREQQLNGMARMVVEREDEISAALRQDLNKPEFEAYASEITGVHSAATEAAKNVSKWMKREKVQTDMKTFPSAAEVISEPLGATFIISAWNYPLLLSLVPVVGAIAGGNVVLLKPSELAPATSALMARLLPLYLDPTAIRVLEGSVKETTALLEQKWDKIFFTGSSRVGRIVLAAAAKHLTPVTLELGGKCPLIVDSTVDMELVGRRVAWGKWCSNNGQACIAPDYLLVEESVVPKVVESIKLSLQKFYGEDPSNSSDISRIVNLNHFKRLSGLLEDKGTAETIIFGGQVQESKLYISPTIVLDPPLDAPVMQEEIFGPILPIITVKDISEAIRFVNSRPKPLAIYLFTADEGVKERVLQQTSSGGVTVNDSILHFVVPGLPFGGVGESGYGSYRGKFSYDTFTHKKAVLERALWGESDYRCPPYPDQKKAVFKSLVMQDFLGLFRALFGYK